MGLMEQGAEQAQAKRERTHQQHAEARERRRVEQREELERRGGKGYEIVELDVVNVKAPRQDGGRVWWGNYNVWRWSVDGVVFRLQPNSRGDGWEISAEVPCACGGMTSPREADEYADYASTLAEHVAVALGRKQWTCKACALDLTEPCPHCGRVS
jgi:hypothetical protein